MFEVQTLIIKIYIPPHCEFDVLEVERTYFLPLFGSTQRQVADMSVLHEHIIVMWNTLC